MKFSTLAFLATAGSAAAFAPSTSFQGRTAPLAMSTETAEETKVRFGSFFDPSASFPSRSPTIYSTEERVAFP